MTTTPQEYEGADVPEAIANACSALNVGRERLDVEIITPGSAGFLGFGKRKARIRVSLKNGADEAAKATRPRRGEADKAPEAEIDPEIGAHLEKTLARILALMEMESEVRVEVGGNRIDALISGPHVEEITADGGAILDSLQYLMRKIASRELTGKLILNLDAGGYRERRKAELEKKALELAARARETGRTLSIGSLNPGERRIVHLALQGQEDIRSRSVGDGHFKKVLIYVPGRSRPRRKTRQ